MSSVFISHNHSDKRFARRLARDLARAGVKCWIDEAEIRVGDSLLDKIQQGIKGSEYLAAVLSPQSVSSPWVKRELEVALNQEMTSGAVKVLPLIIFDCEIPSFVQDRAYADFRTSYKAGLNAVMNRVVPKELLGQRAPGGTQERITVFFKNEMDNPALRRNLSLTTTVRDLRQMNPVKDVWIDIYFPNMPRLEKVELFSPRRGLRLSYEMDIDDLNPVDDDSGELWRKVVSALENEIWACDERIMAVLGVDELAVNWGGPGGSHASAAAEVMYYIDGQISYLMFTHETEKRPGFDKRTLKDLRQSARGLADVLQEAASRVRNKLEKEIAGHNKNER